MSDPDELDRSDRVRGPSRLRIVLPALAFEVGLGIIAITLAAAIGFDWRAELLPSPVRLASAVLWGLVGTIPLAIALVYLQCRPPAALRPLQEVLFQQVLPLFRPLSVIELGILSLAAGIGEELLFRGLQHALAAWWGGSAGIVLGLAVGSVTFGVCHWLNTTYAVVTTIVGVYLGLLLIAGGQIVTPAVTHGAYDFFALIYLTRLCPEAIHRQ